MINVPLLLKEFDREAFDSIVEKVIVGEVDENGNIISNLTNIFLVFAEDEDKERHIMTMKDWINTMDDLLKFRRKKILNNSGNVSHK